MISIDTNVLLRYLLGDDAAQSKKADALINGDDPVLVTDIVLVEAIWTLTGKRYNITRDEVTAVISGLFEERNIIFEDGQTVWCARKDFKNAKPVKVKGKTKIADFADALIINKSKYHLGKLTNESIAVYTFDRGAQEIDGAEKP